MKRLFLSAAIGACLSSGVAFAEPVKNLVRLEGLSRGQICKMADEGYDIAKAGKDFIETVVTKTEKSRFERSGHKVSVLIPDLNAYIAKRLKTQRDAKYYTYETMTQTMKDWAEKYPKIAKLVSLGKSCEGRDIWAMKVSDNPDVDEKEPAILVMGAHHAREWISVEVPMESLKQYLEGFGKDEKLTKLVNEREVWFVPMVNPDGVTYSQTKSQYWRKNRRKVDARNYGVDLNRNYGYKWGNTGASSNPSMDTYHGTAAFSEPESTAIKELAEKEHFQATVSFHSYSELNLYPFGYAYNVPNPDTPTLQKLAAEMTKFNGYKPENSADLYPAMGDTDDYLYGTHKALAFTIELAQEFIPPAEEIAQVNKLNVPAVLHLIDKGGVYAVSTPSGDQTIAAALEMNTALNTLEAGNELLQNYSGEAKVKVNDNLQVVSKRLAEMVSDELLTGETANWDKVKTIKGAEAVQNMIREKVTFAIVHGQVVDPHILAEIQKAR